MPLKVVTEEVEKDVTLLEEADVEFVSLVRHGANRMPFRVVKEDVSKDSVETALGDVYVRIEEKRTDDGLALKILNPEIEILTDGEEVEVRKGGPGSGHHGHKGRPGERGGSAPSSGGELHGPKSDRFPEVPPENWFKDTGSKNEKRYIQTGPNSFIALDAGVEWTAEQEEEERIRYSELVKYIREEEEKGVIFQKEYGGSGKEIAPNLRLAFGKEGDSHSFNYKMWIAATKKAASQVPTDMLKRVPELKINILSTEDYIKATKSERDDTAIYMFKDKQIYINDFLSSRQGATLCRHEIAHHLDFGNQKLIDGEKLHLKKGTYSSSAEWKKVWEREKKSISKYATTHITEGWAEAFSFYTGGGKAKQKLKEKAPETHAYFERLLKKGSKKEDKERSGLAGAEEKEGMPMKTNESSRHAVVQSIIFPKGVSVEKMAAQKGLAWLNEVTALEAEDHGGFSKYVMLDAKSIEDDSVSMMRIGNEGVWAIIGRPTTDVDLSSALSVGKMGETGELNVVQPIMQAPIAEVALPPQRVLFEEVYYREYSNLGNAIMGILGQSCMEPEVRKEAIIAAVEAFKGFLMLALEMIESADGEFALKVEKVVELMVKDVEEKTKKSEGGLKSMFANKEEFVAAVTEIVAGLLDKASSKETEEEKKKRLEEEEKKRLAEEEAKKSGDIVSLTKKIEKLQAEVDDFGNQLKTQSSKDDGDPVKKTEKKSVFSGLLTRAGE